MKAKPIPFILSRTCSFSDENLFDTFEYMYLSVHLIFTSVLVTKVKSDVKVQGTLGA